MDEETIVAVYDTVAHADLAIGDLKQAGIPDSAISRHANATAIPGEPVPGESGEQGFWSRLFGGEPDHDTSIYDRSLQSGATVVTVRVGESHVDRVLDILESHKPVDLEERAAGYALAEPAAAAPVVKSAAGVNTREDESDTIQLAEERVAVGKRLINLGGTRIRRYVVSTPVEQQVTLREERVTLERRPVTDGRAVSNADFSEKTIEMTEMAEQAVIAKTAVVTEEIRLHKDVTDRVETIRDTVRKEEVEIEQIPGGDTASTTGTASPATAYPKV